MVATPSNPAPLYPAIGWVGNLLLLSLLFAFNLCVLPRAPPSSIPMPYVWQIPFTQN